MAGNGRLQWDSVQAPSFYGVTDALRLQNQSLNAGMKGLSEAIGEFQGARITDANRQVMQNMLATASADALQARLANGDIYKGVDPTLVSQGMLSTLASRPDTLLSREVTGYEFDRTREGHARQGNALRLAMDIATPNTTALTREAQAAALPVDAPTKLALLNQLGELNKRGGIYTPAPEPMPGFGTAPLDGSAPAAIPAPEALVSPVGSPQGSANGVTGLIQKAALATGYNPQLALAKISLESGLDPTAKNPNSSAYGLGQLLGKNRALYGTEEQWKDSTFQATATLDFMAKTDADLSKRLGGRALSPAESYMGHLFGPQGAATVLQADPNAKIEDVIASYDKKNAADIVKNNGMAGKTVREVQQMWADKVQGALAKVNGTTTVAPTLANATEVKAFADQLKNSVKAKYGSDGATITNGEKWVEAMYNTDASTNQVVEQLVQDKHIQEKDRAWAGSVIDAIHKKSLKVGDRSLTKMAAGLLLPKVTTTANRNSIAQLGSAIGSVVGFTTETSPGGQTLDESLLQKEVERLNGNGGLDGAKKSSEIRTLLTQVDAATEHTAKAEQAWNAAVARANQLKLTGERRQAYLAEPQAQYQQALGLSDKLLKQYASSNADILYGKKQQETPPASGGTAAPASNPPPARPASKTEKLLAETADRFSRGGGPTQAEIDKEKARRADIQAEREEAMATRQILLKEVQNAKTNADKAFWKKELQGLEQRIAQL